MADPTSGERADSPVRSPHLELLAQVFHRALMDLLLVETSGTPDEEYRARKDAVLFFTNEGDAWADSRELICLALDMDPDVVRRMVIDILEGRRSVTIPDHWQRASIEPTQAIWREVRAERARDLAVAEFAKTARLVARPKAAPATAPRDNHGTLPADWWRATPDMDEYSEIEVQL
jgi:hypothetical protein